MQHNVANDYDKNWNLSSPYHRNGLWNWEGPTKIEKDSNLACKVRRCSECVPVRCTGKYSRWMNLHINQANTMWRRRSRPRKQVGLSFCWHMYTTQCHEVDRNLMPWLHWDKVISKLFRSLLTSVWNNFAWIYFRGLLQLSWWIFSDMCNVAEIILDSCDMQIYVPQLKCQHLGCALVLTFQLRDIYISMSHSPSCIICILPHVTVINITTNRQLSNDLSQQSRVYQQVHLVVRCLQSLQSPTQRKTFYETLRHRSPWKRLQTSYATWTATVACL